MQRQTTPVRFQSKMQRQTTPVRFQSKLQGKITRGMDTHAGLLFFSKLLLLLTFSEALLLAINQPRESQATPRSSRIRRGRILSTSLAIRIQPLLLFLLLNMRSRTDGDSKHDWIGTDFTVKPVRAGFGFTQSKSIISVKLPLIPS